MAFRLHAGSPQWKAPKQAADTESPWFGLFRCWLQNPEVAIASKTRCPAGWTTSRWALDLGRPWVSCRGVVVDFSLWSAGALSHSINLAGGDELPTKLWMPPLLADCDPLAQCRLSV